LLDHRIWWRNFSTLQFAEKVFVILDVFRIVDNFVSWGSWYGCWTHAQFNYTIDCEEPLGKNLCGNKEKKLRNSKEYSSTSNFETFRRGGAIPLRLLQQILDSPCQFVLDFRVHRQLEGSETGTLFPER
jgi:hypothetical protein